MPPDAGSHEGGLASVPLTPKHAAGQSETSQLLSAREKELSGQHPGPSSAHHGAGASSSAPSPADSSLVSRVTNALLYYSAQAHAGPSCSTRGEGCSTANPVFGISPSEGCEIVPLITQPPSGALQTCTALTWPAPAAFCLSDEEDDSPRICRFCLEEEDEEWVESPTNTQTDTNHPYNPHACLSVDIESQRLISSGVEASTSGHNGHGTATAVPAGSGRLPFMAAAGLKRKQGAALQRNGQLSGQLGQEGAGGVSVVQRVRQWWTGRWTGRGQQRNAAAASGANPAYRGGLPESLSTASLASAVTSATEWRKRVKRDATNPLIAPCRCTGTGKYVHRNCLQKWRESNPAAFLKCPVCNYTYQFKGGKVARALRKPAAAPVILLLVLLVLCYGLGFIPCWRDPTNDLGVHMLNGFVLIGLMGFGMTLADLFSSRRATALLTAISNGQEVSQTTSYCVISLFQILAVTLLASCIVVSNMWSWGVVFLAIVGCNHLSCGPVLRGFRGALEKAVGRMDLSTSSMIAQYALPRRRRLRRPRRRVPSILDLPATHTPPTHTYTNPYPYPPQTSAAASTTTINPLAEFYLSQPPVQPPPLGESPREVTSGLTTHQRGGIVQGGVLGGPSVFSSSARRHDVGHFVDGFTEAGRSHNTKYGGEACGVREGARSHRMWATSGVRDCTTHQRAGPHSISAGSCSGSDSETTHLYRGSSAQQGRSEFHSTHSMGSDSEGLSTQSARSTRGTHGDDSSSDHTASVRSAFGVQQSAQQATTTNTTTPATAPAPGTVAAHMAWRRAAHLRLPRSSSSSGFSTDTSESPTSDAAPAMAPASQPTTPAGQPGLVAHPSDAVSFLSDSLRPTRAGSLAAGGALPTVTD